MKEGQQLLGRHRQIKLAVTARLRRSLQQLQERKKERKGVKQKERKKIKREKAPNKRKKRCV
jgi:hypothetical protein